MKHVDELAKFNIENDKIMKIITLLQYDAQKS